MLGFASGAIVGAKRDGIGEAVARGAVPVGASVLIGASLGAGAGKGVLGAEQPSKMAARAAGNNLNALFVAQSVDRVQSSRTVGGITAKKQADRDGEPNCKQNGIQVNYCIQRG